jgi:hypothetical protein
MHTTKKATRSESAPAADPHADAKDKLAETLLAQHGLKDAKRAPRGRPPSPPRPPPRPPRRRPPPRPSPSSRSPWAMAAEPAVAHPAEARPRPRPTRPPRPPPASQVVAHKDSNLGPGWTSSPVTVVSRLPTYSAAIISGGSTSPRSSMASDVSGGFAILSTKSPWTPRR